MMVAHIGYNRKITYYDKKLSQDAIHSIEYYAKYENSSASVTQSYPVLKPVLFSKMDVTELKKLFETKLTNRFENLKIEVAAYSKDERVVVFTTEEACHFLQQYYRYMHTESKRLIYRWVFIMYDRGNTNY